MPINPVRMKRKVAPSVVSGRNKRRRNKLEKLDKPGTASSESANEAESTKIAGSLIAPKPAASIEELPNDVSQ